MKWEARAEAVRRMDTHAELGAGAGRTQAQDPTGHTPRGARVWALGGKSPREGRLGSERGMDHRHVVRLSNISRPLPCPFP